MPMPMPERDPDPDPLLRGRLPVLYDGCRLHPHCLTCPLPACRYDGGWGKRREAQRRERDEAIRRDWMAGATTTTLAVKYRVSQRTVHRVLSGR